MSVAAAVDTAHDALLEIAVIQVELIELLATCTDPSAGARAIEIARRAIYMRQVGPSRRRP